MTKNEGPVDRVIRVVVGLAAAYGSYATSGAARWILGVVALLGLVTGITGVCGIYEIFGINTCPTQKC